MDRLALRTRGATALALLGTASFLTMAGTTAAFAQGDQAVEEVLVTGSLIRGAPAVGVPVTALSDADFKETGALTIADLLKSVPSVGVQTSNNVTNAGGSIEKAQGVTIHNTGGTRVLMMMNGMRFPIQGHGTCYVDPSVVPQLAVDHIDVLADGASATYGSDAVGGVINVVLKKGFDGAVTQVRFGGSPDIGNNSWLGSQLYGTKWSTGDITVDFESYVEAKVTGVQRDYFTMNFEPYGYDDRTPLANADPGVVTTGAPATTAGAPAGFTAATGTRFCANCYSIPLGTGWNYGDTAAHDNPTAPGSAPTTTWGTLLANQGVKNLQNPYRYTDLEPAQIRSGATFTFDQDLIWGISFFSEGFYSNRHAIQFYPEGASPGVENITINTGQVVPTTNPYYPTGAPAGIRVNYGFGAEQDVRVVGNETAGRYAFGLTSDLPYGWNGRVYYSQTEDQNYTHANGMMNRNMISAAVGNTVASVAAAGNIPGQAAFTKPANIPYLNLFCDSNAYQCNSPITMAYITGFRNYDEKWKIVEAGLNADGPVIDLPGGTVRAAIGANHVSNHFYFTQTSNFSAANTSLIAVAYDPEKTAVYAVYGQVNIPVVGEAQGIPLIKSFVLELAYRYDHYNAFGGVKTPKYAMTWDVGYGLTLQGTIGQAFRAPDFASASAAAGVFIPPVNTLAGASANTLTLNCPSVNGSPAGVAIAGSLNFALNPTCAGDQAHLTPGGINVNGSAGGAAPLRNGPALGPETAHNWSAGFDFRPTDFLAGLDLNATMWHLRIDNRIAGLSGGVNTNDPLTKVCTAPGTGCIYFVRANPNLPITDPVNALFLQMATALVTGPKSQADPTFLPNVQFLQDAALTNSGTQQYTGIDFGARYDWDWGDWGAWNTGITGTYPTKQTSQSPGQAVNDTYVGKNSGGLLKYRGRLGWTQGGLSITGFVNFTPHGGPGGNLPPNCYWAAGFSAGSCYPGSPYWGGTTGQNIFYGSMASPVFLFDLSAGYQTGTTPANRYLQNLNLQLTINNILNKAPQFQYSSAITSNYPHAFNAAINPQQRYVSIGITKAW